LMAFFTACDLLTDATEVSLPVFDSATSAPNSKACKEGTEKISHQPD